MSKSREENVADLSQMLKAACRGRPGWLVLSSAAREEIEITLARIANQCIVLESAEQKTTSDGAEWTPWPGGDMPVLEGSLLDIEYQDGVIQSNTVAGSAAMPGRRGAHVWSRRGLQSDIVAWRYSQAASIDSATPADWRAANRGFDWETWHGGVCPVDDDVIVDVQLRAAATPIYRRRADAIRWSHGGDYMRKEFDVIAWRLAK